MGRYLKMRLALVVLGLACAVSAVNLEVTPVSEIRDAAANENQADMSADDDAGPPSVSPEKSQANMKKWEKEGKVVWDGTHMKDGVAIADVQSELQRMTREESELGDSHDHQSDENNGDDENSNDDENDDGMGDDE